MSCINDPELPDTGGGCCIGADVYGPGGCTCWRPVHDLDQADPAPHVLGLDLGLATAGAAQLHRDGRVYTQQLHTDPLPDDASVPEQAARLRRVARWAVERATTATVLVVVEGPSLGSRHGQAHERAGIWWRVVDSLVRHEIPVAVVPPSTAKKYIAGHGRADKEAVRKAVAAALPEHGLHAVSSHESDAVALALCGTDWLLWPGPFLSGRRGSAVLSNVRWPERESIRG